jgi:hypothetical protein
MRTEAPDHLTRYIAQSFVNVRLIGGSEASCNALMKRQWFAA